MREARESSNTFDALDEWQVVADTGPGDGDGMTYRTVVLKPPPGPEAVLYCNCAGTPPTMPTYRALDDHLPSCSIYLKRPDA